jgi:hypothetical protein
VLDRGIMMMSENPIAIISAKKRWKWEIKKWTIIKNGKLNFQ